MPEVGGIDLWSVDLAGVARDRLEALSADERKRAQRMERLRGTRAPAAFAPSRAALRAVLGCYLGVAATSIELELGEHDRPTLRGAGRKALDFNLSHTGERALIAVGSPLRVGIDIERVDATRDISGLAARFFTEAEGEVIFASEDPVRTFYRFWTCKEAYLKAIGTGLSRSPRSFDIRLDASGGRADVVDAENAESTDALLCEVRAGDAHAVSLCALGAPSQLRVFDASEWVS